MTNKALFPYIASNPQILNDKTMGCLGVLFSLDARTVAKLKSFQSDEDRLDYLQMEIEETYMEEHPHWTCELDKAWDAIHRTLTNGKLEWDGGTYPLNHFILGGEILYFETDYIMTLKTPEQVADIANTIDRVKREIFRQKYFSIDPNDYGFATSEDDFEYTWHWFAESVGFWKTAAAEKRFVLFSADQ